MSWDNTEVSAGMPDRSSDIVEGHAKRMLNKASRPSEQNPDGLGADFKGPQATGAAPFSDEENSRSKLLEPGPSDRETYSGSPYAPPCPALVDAARDNSAVLPTSPIGGPEMELPVVLRPDRVDGYWRQFLNEYQPVGATEHALVRDLARQVAAMERWEEAAEAVERNAARNLPQLATTFLQPGTDSQDAILSGAVSTDLADRCERHSLARSRAFCRTLTKLRELQTQRKDRERRAAEAVPRPFANEADCEAYLEQRLRDKGRRCDSCSHSGGYFLPSRRSWECVACHVQAGLRSGTVMAGSAIPLLVWFEAIRSLLDQPTIGTSKLAERIGIRRLTTVRSLARRIREAMALADATERLAGLDHYYRSGRS